MSSSLHVSIGELKLRHPVMNASGILGSEPAHVDILVDLGFSAVVSKTFTRERREGYSTPIIVELRNGGLLNAVGLANPGKIGIAPFVKRGRELNVPIIVSVGGSSEEEFAELAIEAERSGASAIEVNLSCPHVKGAGLEIGSDPSAVFSVIKSVSSAVSVPVFAKLGLNDKVVDIAGKALEGGADGLVLINTIRAMAIDVYAMRPILSNKFGGLSGPPIHPIAVMVVYDIYAEYGAEIIGCGGISTWEDAAEMILAGAKAIQIGTALAFNKDIVREVVSGLEKWLRDLGASSIEELVGASHRA